MTAAEMNTQWKLVPVEPTRAMVDRAVAFALNVAISSEYRWTDYMTDVWAGMLAASPAAQTLVADDRTALLARIAELEKALQGLLVCWDEYRNGNQNQEQAFYLLAKYAYDKWDAARAALAGAQS